jgi:hypothetical protein
MGVVKEKLEKMKKVDWEIKTFLLPKFRKKQILNTFFLFLGYEKR